MSDFIAENVRNEMQKKINLLGSENAELKKKLEHAVQGFELIEELRYGQLTLAGDRVGLDTMDFIFNQALKISQEALSAIAPSSEEKI